jgi:hypothetical protein
MLIEDDPSGTRFTFEMGTVKSSGGQGWTDVAKLGYFCWEYKRVVWPVRKAQFTMF